MNILCKKLGIEKEENGFYYLFTETQKITAVYHSFYSKEVN